MSRLLSMSRVSCGDDFSHIVWWIQQDEIQNFVNSLMDNIPHIIRPLVDIIKEYTGLHGLFAGLHLHCYDHAHHLRPATIGTVGRFGVVVKFDSDADEYDSLVVRWYNHRLVGDHLVQWKPQNDHTCCKKLR